MTVSGSLVCDISLSDEDRASSTGPSRQANARYYVPEVGRFASPDTIVPDPSNPQSFNRYSYVNNSPVNYTDPSGHCVTNDQEITRGDAFDCTVDEMSLLSWETRQWWLQMFMDDFNVEWFHNILGILDYFAGDPQFSDLAGWASLSDAGVLVVIQDGWRQFNNRPAINDSSAALRASGAWAEFFSLQQQLGDDSSLVASQWGVAEQAGVNFGVAIAEPLKRTSNLETRIEIATFVAFGNIYRSLISNQAEQILSFDLEIAGRNPAHIFDPRTTTSRSFVRGWSRYVVSYLAAELSGR